LDTQVRHLPKSQVELTLSLTAEEVDEYFAQVYHELADIGRIPGFRPGKAPRIIVRRFYGADHITGSVWMELVQGALPKALEEHPDFRLIGDPVFPDFDELPLNEGQPVSLAVIITIYPTATLGEVSGVKLLRPTTDVEDEDTEAVIDKLREERAEWVEVSRAVAPGDRVTADVTMRVDGEERATQEDVVFEAAPAEEDEQARVPAAVLGHLIAQEAVAREEFPEDFEDSAMAGKTVEYVATIKRVEEKHLPDADDALAADVGGFDTMDELREDIRGRLAEEREREAQESLESQATACLLANVDLDLPDALVSEATQVGLQELDHRLDAVGSSLDELAEAGAIDRGELEDRQRQRAVLGLEARIAMDALIEGRELEPEEQDVQAEIENLSRETNNPVTFVRQAYEVQEEVTQRIDERARTRRALRWIIENGEVEELPRAEFQQRYRELMDQLEAQRRERREAIAAAAEAAAQAAQAEAEAETAAEVQAAAEEQAKEVQAAAPEAAEAQAETEAGEQVQAEPEAEAPVEADTEPEMADEPGEPAEEGKAAAEPEAEAPVEADTEPEMADEPGEPADEAELATEPADQPEDEA